MPESVPGWSNLDGPKQKGNNRRRKVHTLRSLRIPMPLRRNNGQILHNRRHKASGGIPKGFVLKGLCSSGSCNIEPVLWIQNREYSCGTEKAWIPRCCRGGSRRRLRCSQGGGGFCRGDRRERHDDQFLLPFICSLCKETPPRNIEKHVRDGFTHDSLSKAYSKNRPQGEGRFHRSLHSKKRRGGRISGGYRFCNDLRRSRSRF